jgi:hypothetical protein
MQEIKLRIAVIEQFLDDKRTTKKFPVDIELLALQFIGKGMPVKC